MNVKVGQILEVQDLTVYRNGSSPALQLDYLSLNSGEILVIIGPNGSGKSTLLLTLNLLLKPHRGKILFRGQPISKRDALTYRRRLALVLQDPLLLDLSVFDNVATGLRFRKIPKKEIKARVEKWLDRFGILGLRSRSARHLSGGEAQRVSLARAFATDPDILLLDEPFSALDAPTKARILEDFQALLAETSQTSIFVTHDLNEALLLGNRVGVILDGKLRQQGTPEAVFTNPIDPQVAAFVGVETVIPGSVLSIKDGLTTIAVTGHNLEIVGETDVGREVFVCLRPEDITLWVAEKIPDSSARNRLAGNIQRIVPQGALIKVILDCGFPLSALITLTSANNMGLQTGQEIVATFKASAAHLINR
jgi:tungstate transport system ATP-binding protein